MRAAYLRDDQIHYLAAHAGRIRRHLHLPELRHDGDLIAAA
jgi:hypothetical protein